MARSTPLIGERATTEPYQRDWLFPFILGALLVGCLGSFAMAWIEQVAPHLEAKVTLDRDHSLTLDPSGMDKSHNGPRE